MTIIIKIGRPIIQLFWAIIALLGVVLISDGFFNANNILSDFVNRTLDYTATLSQISGGIVIVILGLVGVAAGYLGIRGRIIITASEDAKQNPTQ
jgi:hypothetical protein